MAWLNLFFSFNTNTENDYHYCRFHLFRLFTQASNIKRVIKCAKLEKYVAMNKKKLIENGHINHQSGLTPHGSTSKQR